MVLGSNLLRCDGEVLVRSKLGPLDYTGSVPNFGSGVRGTVVV